VAQSHGVNPSIAVILLIDNYDSFVHNLSRYLVRLGHATRVVRNDAISVDDLPHLQAAAIVLSPGPCTPAEAGISMDVVRQLHHRIPILGVCLGHQVIASAFGGRIVRADEPMHGRTSEVFHDGRGVFSDLPQPLTACRYHSLVVEEASLPDCLEVSARTSDGTVMAIRHRRVPTVGVQFHPESILTEGGYALLTEFLRQADLSVPEILPGFHNELRDARKICTGSSL
jgi:anthranilate synthase/aminodeoxychorismate synthase-like glutamine amidotransferase